MKAAEAGTEQQPLLGSSRLRQTFRNRAVRRRENQLFVLTGFLIFVFVLALLFAVLSELKYKIKPVTPPIQLPHSVKHFWAQYTPYYSTSSYTKPPRHCRITQVNILQRHGARLPASDQNEGQDIQAAVSKLKSASKYLDPRLEFLTYYTYDLGEDDLIAFGAAQSFDSGQYDYLRYQDLVTKSKLPFVRASGSTRVVDSAANWTAGFAHASGRTVIPHLDLIIKESPDINNTLNSDMCPNAGDSSNQTKTWQSIYAPGIAGRINASAPGANVTADDITNLISLCALETTARIEASDFCGIFGTEDFEDFEYFGDLDKYYGNGYGLDLGPVQGVGYINELIARLTSSPVRDNTQTNHTLTSDPKSFPLDRPIYADFSHENEMISIYSALGLFRQSKDLDPRRPDIGRTWITARLVPFSARLVTEKLECLDAGDAAGADFVRILVNDRIQELDFCGANGDKLCELDAFVRSQQYARNDGAGDFEKCFV